MVGSGKKLGKEAAKQVKPVEVLTVEEIEKWAGMDNAYAAGGNAKVYKAQYPQKVEKNNLHYAKLYTEVDEVEEVVKEVYVDVVVKVYELKKDIVIQKQWKVVFTTPLINCYI